MRIERINSGPGRVIPTLVLLLILSIAIPAAAQNPLPSWNEGAARNAILDFVRSVTTAGGAEYVAPEDRIAVFDNDGTLWAELPAYFQLLFAIDRVRAMAPQHPEWKTQQPFKAVLDNDMKALAAGSEHGLTEIIAVTHAGMTTDEFASIVKQWIETTRHPQTGKPYTEMVYKPMVELLGFLRANGFKTYIVSGGGVEFMRPWVEKVYGIPPEQVIGSTIRTRFELRDGKAVLMRLPQIDFVNDKEGKPVAINRVIGRRPIAAFGNSDGDLAMLQWTASGSPPRLMMIVHHTDAAREWAYDRQSHIGRLDKALTEATTNKWTIVDMKRDWGRVFAFE